MSSPLPDKEGEVAKDEVDPTYTHFAHQAEFMALLRNFLAIDPTATSTAEDNRVEKALVGDLGAIVRMVQQAVLTSARQLSPHAWPSGPRA